MLSFSCFFRFHPFVLSSLGRMCLLFFATQLPLWQAAPLSSLGNECPLLVNPLIANSGTIGLVPKQALYLNFLSREHKRNYNLFSAYFYL